MPAMSGIRNIIKNGALLRQNAFVGGLWRQSDSGKFYKVINPFNGEVLADVPDMNDKDTDLAINMAYDAYKLWRETTGRERGSILRKWFGLMQDNLDDLAKILTAETGKPLSEAKGEVSYGASFIEWFSEEAKRIQGEIPESPSSNKEMLFIRQPIGVAGMITPWNFPNAMITRKAGAAMAAGCTCVVRPAEDTPLSALALAALADDAGVPKGVFNVITSSRQNASIIGNVLCTHEKIAGISFTGSTAVGKLLYKQCSEGVKRLGLELGGNAPFIVFNSARVNTAINSLFASKFRNAGQTCISSNRILVQSGIYDEFMSRLKSTMMSQLVVGDGMKDGVNIGPLINKAQLHKVDNIVNKSLEQGASLILGGRRHSEGELFYEPTLLTNCSTTMDCFNQEIFGPVISVKKFETEEEAIDISNNTNRGLASYFCSQDISQVMRVMRRLEAGMVGVNEGLISCAEAAFGGIKESGVGREGSRHGLDDYTYLKYICIGDILK